MSEARGAEQDLAGRLLEAHVAYEVAALRERGVELAVAAIDRVLGLADAVRLDDVVQRDLVKGVAECHQAETPAQREHVDRMAEALRFEPCSPTCANWLRYGVQPKNAKRGLTPGFCRGKAHRRAHLGYGGRRVLVSRKWSGKTMADHKKDRRDWVLARLAEAGISATDTEEPGRYLWDMAKPGDPGVKPPDHRLLLLIDERIRQRQQLRQAQELSATVKEAA